MQHRHLVPDLLDPGVATLLYANAAGLINNEPARAWLSGTDGAAIPYNCQFVPYGPNSCDTIQGYILSPPLSTARFERGILRNPDWMNDASLRLPVAPTRPLDDDDDDDRTVRTR